MRPSARRSDDADVIRARLRAVLAEMGRQPGWVPPDDLLDEGDEHPTAAGQHGRPAAPAHDPDDRDDDLDDDLDDPDDGLPGGLGRHRAPGPAARLDPGRPGARALCAAALAAAVLVGGWTWADRPEVEPVTAGVAATSSAASPNPSAAPGAEEPTDAGPAPASSAVLVVSVVGQVAQPGLVMLPVGSRVADALAAAGGLLPEADPAAVNAAALLTDGQQIAVGVPGAPAGAPPGTSGAGPGRLDLNAATVADLDALPGIGPVLAQRIVDHRTTQGPFTSVEQLDDVNGIGPAIYAELAELVTV